MVYMYTGTVYTFQCYKQMVVRNQAYFVASGAEGGTLACSGGHVCIAAHSMNSFTTTSTSVISSGWKSLQYVD